MASIRIRPMVSCLRWACLVVCLSQLFSAPAFCFDCGQLQTSWQDRLALLQSDKAYFPPSAPPIEANDALYRAYIDQLLLHDQTPQRCGEDDPLVAVANALALVLNGGTDVEGVSARLAGRQDILSALWEMDVVVGRMPEFRDQWLERYGDIPSFVVGDMLTQGISLETPQALALWLAMLNASDGFYAEQFGAYWIPELLRDKPEVVLARIQDLLPLERRIRNSFCVDMLPEQNEELREVYGPLAGDPAAVTVLQWLECVGYPGRDG